LAAVLDDYLVYATFETVILLLFGDLEMGKTLYAMKPLDYRTEALFIRGGFLGELLLFLFPVSWFTLYASFLTRYTS